jgi:hypothetical protein
MGIVVDPTKAIQAIKHGCITAALTRIHTASQPHSLSATGSTFFTNHAQKTHGHTAVPLLTENTHSVSGGGYIH